MIQKKFRSYFHLAVLSFFLVACGSQKKVASKADISLRKIIHAHEEAGSHFETLRARIHARYTTEHESQSISISLRMKKDKAIWLSAKLAGIFPLAKILITPEGVKYYEKINKTYFEGDFALLSKWIGMPLDFQKVQHLLTGQSIYPLKTRSFTLTGSDRGYALSSKEKAILYKSILLNPKTFKAKVQQITRATKQQSLTVTYPKYVQKNTFSFPKEIKVLAHQEGKSTEIAIEYRTLDFDVPVSFPFEIPSGYQKITIQ